MTEHRPPCRLIGFVTCNERREAIYARDVFFTIFRAQADRVIASVRLTIAIGGLFITWLDGTHPPASPLIVRTALFMYLVFAVISAWQVWNTVVPRVRGTLVRHVIDLLFIAIIMYASDGPTNPFTRLLPFAILAGTLHWRWKGALWTSLACGVILAVVVATNTRESLDLDTEATGDASLILFIVASSTLLVWLGVREDAMRTDLLKSRRQGSRGTGGSGLAGGARVGLCDPCHPAKRAVLIWTDGEEPWTYVGVWENGTVTNSLLPPDSNEHWVAKEIETESIFGTAALDGAVRIHRGGGRFDEWSGSEPAVNPALSAAYELNTYISVAFKVGDVNARLFLVDPPRLSLDQVAIAEIVADRLRTLFEHSMLTRRLSHTAAMEERVKIGRELHDGFLQALAGTALELEGMRTVLSKSPEAVAIRLKEVQATLSEEQSRFRTFVRALETVGEPSEAGISHLSLHFDLLVAHLKGQWPIDIRFAFEPRDAQLPALTTFRVTKVLTDAVSSVARLQHARTITASANVQHESVAIDLEHDGQGEPDGRNWWRCR